MEKEVNPDAWTPWTLPRAVIDEEMTELQKCEWKYPNQKAIRCLGYRPHVSFTEGFRRTLSWLEFAGYPIVSTTAP